MAVGVVSYMILCWGVVFYAGFSNVRLRLKNTLQLSCVSCSG